MKIQYLAIALLLAASPAHAEDASDCDNIKHVTACLPLDEGSFDNVQKYKISPTQYFVTAHDIEASGEYNPFSWAYLYDKNERQVYDLTTGGLIWVDVDARHKIVSSFNKGRNIPDVGIIEIYEINTETHELDLLQTFRTDGDASAYQSESGDEDKAFGYIKRAKQFIRDNGYNLKLIMGLNTSAPAVVPAAIDGGQKE